MLKTLLICALALVGCTSFSPRHDKILKLDVPIDLGFNPFVLDICTDNSYGRAFIANGYMWSAEHIFKDEYVNTEDDLKLLGPAPIFGLSICSKEHHIGDVVYYREPRGIIYSVETADW